MIKASLGAFIILLSFCSLTTKGQGIPQVVTVEAFDSSNLNKLYFNHTQLANVKSGLSLIENFLKKKTYHT